MKSPARCRAFDFLITRMCLALCGRQVSLVAASCRVDVAWNLLPATCPETLQHINPARASNYELVGKLPTSPTSRRDHRRVGVLPLVEVGASRGDMQ